MIWLLPLAVYLLIVWAMGALEKHDHFWWSALVCILGGVATFAAILYAYHASAL